LKCGLKPFADGLLKLVASPLAILDVSPSFDDLANL
jgi:hypothetical protein